MIDGLFNQSSYLAAKKMLDATALRHEAISSNIANLETPGYKRIDVSPNFQSELGRAIASQDDASLAEIRPELATDSSATAVGPDGNNVELENELVQMNQNTVAHTVESQLISSKLLQLRLAITGRTS